MSESRFEEDLTLAHSEVCDCNQMGLSERRCKEVRAAVRAAHAADLRETERRVRAETQGEMPESRPAHRASGPAQAERCPEPDDPDHCPLCGSGNRGTFWLPCWSALTYKDGKVHPWHSAQRGEDR